VACESAPLGPTKELVRIRTLSLTTCSTPFPPTPFPIFLPHITSLPAYKTRMIGHNGVLPPTNTSQVALIPQPLPYSLAPPKQDEFFSFPFFHFNLNRYRTTTRSSHACRPLRCSRPTRLMAHRLFPRWHADRSLVLATHALRLAAPTTTWLY